MTTPTTAGPTTVPSNDGTEPAPPAQTEQPGGGESDTPTPDASPTPITQNNLILPSEMYRWESPDDDWTWATDFPYPGEGQSPPLFCQTEQFGARDVWVGTMKLNGTEAFTEVVAQFGSEAEAQDAMTRYMQWPTNCAETLRSQGGVELSRQTGPIALEMPDVETFPQMFEIVYPGTAMGDDGSGVSTYLSYGFIQQGDRVMVLTYWVASHEDEFDPNAQAHPMHDLIMMGVTTIQR